MRFQHGPIDGIVIIDVEAKTDERGAFARTYCDIEFADEGLPISFPQCNLSMNDHAGTLRGMHFNVEPFGEAKLIRCVRGAIYDVVVDLRPGSPTRFDHLGIELTAENRRAIFVPAGFAHGFVTLVDQTDVYYHMGSHYVPHAARGLRWDDPFLAIDWPITPSIMSVADRSYADLDPRTFDLEAYPS
jgi:dTDP-4-dehydrorhamnose 3,5-epimerase